MIVVSFNYVHYYKSCLGQQISDTISRKKIEVNVYLMIKEFVQMDYILSSVK